MTETVIQKTQEGDLVAVTRLSDEQFAILQQLNESHSWKLYRQLLIQAKQGFMDAALPMKDPNEILKTIGMVAGINLAVNQLGILMASLKQRQAKTVENETKNSPQARVLEGEEVI